MRQENKNLQLNYKIKMKKLQLRIRGLEEKEDENVRGNCWKKLQKKLGLV